jgi:hypothetical protein
MGDGGTSNPHIEPSGASAAWQASMVHYEPTELQLKLPKGRQQAYTDARLNKDPHCRPTYWRGVDWREHLGKALEPMQQGPHQTCVGFAVAAALRANILLHRGFDPGALNPYFIWGLARERDPQLRNRRAGLLEEALAVVNMYGTPNDGSPTFADVEKEPFTPKVEKYAVEFTDIEAASQRKIQALVNLGIWLGDWSAWLHKQGPIVANMTIQRTAFDGLKKGNARISFDQRLAHEGELSRTYASHSVVVVGYIPVGAKFHDDTFIIMNSFGKPWGEDGFAFVPVETAQRCFVAGYGLLFREHLGHNFAGRPIATASALPAGKIG